MLKLREFDEPVAVIIGEDERFLQIIVSTVELLTLTLTPLTSET
jgi:hypothetical protein